MSDIQSFIIAVTFPILENLIVVEFFYRYFNYRDRAQEAILITILVMEQIFIDQLVGYSGFYVFVPIITLLIFAIGALNVESKQALAAVLLPFVMMAIINTGVLLTVSLVTETNIEHITEYQLFTQSVEIFSISKMLLIITMWYIINRHKHQKIKIWFSSGSGYFIMPLLSMLIMVALLSIFMETPVEGITYLVAGVIIMALILLNIIFYYYIRKYFDEQQANQKLSFNQQKYELQVENSREINHHIQEIRMFRHEYKRILMVINQYVKNNQKEEIEKLIQENLQELEHIPALIQTNNNILNYVINQKLAEAAKLNIDCKLLAQISLPYISDSDLASLFGNLLDNAIEASCLTEEKYLEIRLTRKKQMDFIVMKNSINESVIDIIEHMQTTKQEKHIHGIGLKKIKEVVLRYGGDIYFFEEEKQLTCQIAFHDESIQNSLNSRI